MIRILVPTSLFAAMVAFYLYSSGAPLRVHTCAIGCLLLGFWLPAALCGDIPGLRTKFAWWLVPALLAILAWDMSPLIIHGKVEPLDGLRYRPWAYPLSLLLLSLLIAFSAALASVATQLARRQASSTDSA